MEKRFIRIGHLFYATAMLVYGVQQFVYGTFRRVFFPQWQESLPVLPVWAYLFGIYLIANGLGIILHKNARHVLLMLGGTLLFTVIFIHLPYELISEPNKIYHLGLWAPVLKELALSGGAFILAGTYPDELAEQKRPVFRFLERFIPYGNFGFCSTLIAFGTSHYFYAEPISHMVPEWMPDHMLWTLLAGTALIGSGVFIVLNLRRKVIAILLSTMIFIWLLTLHIPDAWANPYINRGNQLASAFDALAFSGIALVIAFSSQRQAGDEW